MKTFDAGGVRIAFLEEPATGQDSGSKVLLLHGFASSARVNWVETGWVSVLTEAGYRTIVPDQRGHGSSDKPQEPDDYTPDRMAEDACALLDHLHTDRADVIGYSMGARVAAFLALNRPGRVRSVVFGGLGSHLVEGGGLPPGLGRAMEATSIDDISDPTQRMFRRFAEAGGNDLRALAACIRGSRRNLTSADVGRIGCPALVAVGTRDLIAGDARRLAAMLPQGQVLDIPGRDHNPAVGDKAFKAGVLAFLSSRP